MASRRLTTSHGATTSNVMWICDAHRASVTHQHRKRLHCRHPPGLPTSPTGPIGSESFGPPEPARRTLAWNNRSAWQVHVGRIRARSAGEASEAGSKGRKGLCRAEHTCSQLQKIAPPLRHVDRLGWTRVQVFRLRLACPARSKKSTSPAVALAGGRLVAAHAR